MKRLFTFLFALLSICTFSSYAAVVNGTCGDNLTWTLNTKDSTLVIAGEGEMKDYNQIIQAFASWSEYNSYIKYVTIKDSVTNIGNYAFLNCDNLTSITIPNSVTSIGDHAFYECSSLKSITIPDSVTNIGNYAFYGCHNLTSIAIPDGIISIGLSTFESCSGLTSVTIPNSVTSIGNYVFAFCSSLTSITIPNSVTSIGDHVFFHCSGLKSISIPDSVTSIGDYTFYGCCGLTSVTLGNSIATIGELAFYGCSRLTSITIPEIVTSIGDHAFAWCESMTSVTIGSGVTSIGNEAFEYCNKIQEVISYAATPPSATNCKLIQTSCTLYVPAEYVGIYTNSVWWEDFAKIRAIGSDWDVEFVDWDATILATMKVLNGEAATAPADPVREGYTFIGWDKDFSSVTEDMTVTAQYQINRYQVSFYDWDDTLLKTDSVDYQAAATAPDAPTRLGYTFIGWDKDFSYITADLDVYAQYEAGADKEFEVIFSDQDNNELSTQSVTLRVPLAPEINGFTFLYWQPVAAPISDMITIQAVYESNTPSAAPEVFVNPANPAQKLIRNGQVYILHEDKMYTISGQVVK